MATVTSDEGYFQITACTFTPRVVAVGETATFSITIKNISGKSVTGCYVRMYGSYPSPATTSGSFPDVYLHGGPSFAMKSISWGNNVSQTFTGTYTFTKGFYAVDESNYVFPTGNSSKMFLTIVSNATFTNGTNYSNFSDIRANGENLCVLSKRDNPKLSMEMERTPNDESTTVKTSVKLSADVTSTVLTNHGYTFKLYRSSAHDPATTSDTQTTLNCTLAQMYTGVTNSTSAVTTTFSNQSEWYFTLVLTNGYETAVANTSIPRAFANVHLSGCASGGVAFGKFSAATEGSPIFECEYPAKFDAQAQFPGGVKVTEQVLTVASAFKPYTASANSGYVGVILRHNGVMVEIYGTVSPSSSISGSTTPYVICNIPAALSPKYQINQICQGTNQNIWLLRIDPDGAVTFARYRTSSSWNSASNTVWLPFHCVWML